MKTVVLYGDSNTWGYIPGSMRERYPREVRWPTRLAAALGDGVDVIVEGLSGRTATIDRPESEGRNGLPYLIPCLHSHAPIDLLVIFLGTNDAYVLEPDVVAASVGRLVKTARYSESGPGFGPPEILVVCPPPFDGYAFSEHFAYVCDQLGCQLLDLADVTEYTTVGLDTCHLDEAGHAAVAVAVEERVRALLA